MRLRDVIKQTGLTKRTIYYYIEEQFLHPKIDNSNGYYDFSEEDIARLNMLHQLRKADFSIKDIHVILKHPTSAYIYIKKQMETLQKEQELLTRKIQSLQKLYDQLPILVSSEDFSTAVFQTDFPDNTITYTSDLTQDVDLLSVYLWTPFLNGITMTEYRKFLWDKLLNETAKVPASQLSALKKHIYSLSAEQLDHELQLRTKHIETVAALTPTTLPQFVQNACIYITSISTDETFAIHWKADYHNWIQTTTQLYDSDFNSLMTELSPLFSSYYRNIHICCDQIYDWLISPDGRHVKDQLSKHLENYLDLSAMRHAEIAALFGTGMSQWQKF